MNYEHYIFFKQYKEHISFKNNGNRIAAPYLRNELKVELIRILLRPKYLTFGFRSKDLLVDFSKNPKTVKIGYELGKLIERGLVKKMEKANYYVVTKNGWIWIWSCLFQKDFVVNPLLSVIFRKEIQKNNKPKAKKHYPDKAIKHPFKPDVPRLSDSCIK